MAIIKCSECGKEISDRALSCPHCGKPFLFLKNCHKKYPNLKLILLLLILPASFCYYANYKADYYGSFEDLWIYYLLILCGVLPALFIRYFLLKRPIKWDAQWISLLISWPLFIVVVCVVESADIFRVADSIGTVMLFASIPLTNAILLAGTGKFILFKKDIQKHKMNKDNCDPPTSQLEPRPTFNHDIKTLPGTIVPEIIKEQQYNDRPQSKEKTEIDLLPKYSEGTQDVEEKMAFFKSGIWKDLRLPLLWIPGVAVAVNIILIVYLPFLSGFQDPSNIGILEIIIFSVISAIISNLVYLTIPLLLRFLILKTPMKSMGISTLGATFILGLGARLLLIAMGLTLGKTSNVPILQAIAIYYVLTAGNSIDQFIYREHDK